jgi:DNA-binding CsgD family transcriptional regulator
MPVKRCRGKTPAGRCKRPTKPGYDTCQFHQGQSDSQPQRPQDTLSPRQLQCAMLAAKGKTNKQIAEVLDISPSTVDVHMREVTRRMGAHRRELREMLEHG